MTQAQSILRFLQSGRALTPLQALSRFGCMRAAARIKDLRALGYRIKTTRINVGRAKKVASYSMAGR